MSTRQNSSNYSVWLLLLIGLLAVLSGLAYITIDVDFPFKIATNSRALYVDEGFYSDAAQNFVKFGTFELPNDTKHWPGAPLLTVLQTPVFSVFGPTITAVRMLSVIISAIGCLAFYLLARERFRPAMAAMLCLAAITSIGFLGHARSAIPDPIALSMAMLAMLAFVKLKNRYAAVVVSLVLAYLSFLAKMYFFFSVAALVTVWGGEILLAPFIIGRSINWRLLFAFLITLLFIIASYVWFRLAFGESMNDFMIVNAKKRMLYGIESQLKAALYSLWKLPHFTKIVAMYYALWIALGYLFFAMVFRARSLDYLISSIRSISRSEWVMAVFFAGGLVVVGSLQEHKWHYYYFAIFPLVFLTAAAIYRINISERRRNLAIFAILLLHVSQQMQLNMQWLNRGNSTTIADASIAIVRTIEAETNAERVPVIGEYSQVLGLYSRTILGIDTLVQNPGFLCERINYWKPKYHVYLTWTGSWTPRRLEAIVACPEISGYEEISRYKTMPGFSDDDEIVLSRLNYYPFK